MEGKVGAWKLQFIEIERLGTSCRAQGLLHAKCSLYRNLKKVVVW